MASTQVRVALRIRPLSTKERLSDNSECIFPHPQEPNQVVLGRDRCFSFDRVFGTETTQENIYLDEVQSLVERFLDGYNVTILAYGQTSSGKSYTMGTSLDGNIDIEPDTHGKNSWVRVTPGIIPRSINFIFEKLSRMDNHSFDLCVSFLELHNEELVDLFQTRNVFRSNKNVIQLREDTSGGIVVVNILELNAISAKETIGLLQKGLLCRTTASTDMNLVSSRSHAIFTLILKQDKQIEGEMRRIVSKFNFVDLAGSERLKRTNATGDRVKESISINCGLLALGNVISALGDESRKSQHVPYRDSKLTRLLQDSLGGNSQTFMIACVSPADSNFMETLNTLKYANRARNIKNKVSMVQDHGRSDFEILQLRQLVASLKKQLNKEEGRDDDVEAPEIFKDQILSLETDIRQLNLTIVHLEQRVKTLSNELATVQSERDTLRLNLPEQNTEDLTEKVKPLIEEYLKEINELKMKLKDKQFKHPPVVVDVRKSIDDYSSKLHTTIAQAREEIDKARELIDQRVPESEEQAINEMMNQIQRDISLKETVVKELEISYEEHKKLKENYERDVERLQEKLAQAQKERDANVNSNSAEQNIQKYEEKVTKMENELNELRRKHMEDLKTVKQKSSSTENLIESMKTSIISLKQEKVKLSQKLKEETLKTRTLEISKEKEIRTLKNKEQKANQLAKKLEISVEQQKMLLKRRSEEGLAFKKRLKMLMKGFTTKKKAGSHSDPDLRRSFTSRIFGGGKSTKPDDFLYQNVEDFTNNAIKKKVELEREIEQYVENREASLLMDELVKKRDTLVEERNSLQESREKIATYLAETPDAPPEDYKPLQDIEERMEILEAEIMYLTDARIKSIQEEAVDETNEDLSGYNNAIQLLKTLTVSEADTVFQQLIDDFVSLKINDKARHFTEESLGKTVSDLKQTLQLMRKASWEAALEHEQKMQESQKRYQETVNYWEKRYQRLKNSMNSDKKSRPPPAPTPSDDHERGRKLKNNSEAAERHHRSKSITSDTPTSSSGRAKKERTSSDSSINTDLKKVLSEMNLSAFDVQYDVEGPLELVQMFQGHGGAVYSIAFSADKSKMFTASQDSTIRLWSLEQGGDSLESINAGQGFVRSLVSKNNLLYSGCQNTIKIWEDQNFKAVRQLSYHTDDIETLALSSDGNYLYAGSSDSTVSVWDVRAFKQLSTFSGHKGAVFTMSLFNEDKYLFTGSRDHWIKIYDTKSFELVTTLHPPHYDVVQCLAISNNTLLSGSRDYSLKKWDLSPLLEENIQPDTLKISLRQTNLSAHRDWIRAMAKVDPPPDDTSETISSIATGARDGMIKWWDVDSMERLAEQKLHDSSINFLTSNNGHIFTASSDRSIRMWKYRN